MRDKWRYLQQGSIANDDDADPIHDARIEFAANVDPKRRDDPQKLP